MIERPTNVVFELGLNHMGDEDRALRMLDELKAQGATHVTIQVISDVSSFTRNTDTIKFLQRHCLTLSQNLDVIRYGLGLGLNVGATVLDPRTIGELRAAGVSFFKILSGDLTYSQIVDEASATGLPVYLSTGASTMEEIARALEQARASQPGADLRLIHTVLVVPTPPELLNLRNIATLSQVFGLPVAYGQHSDLGNALELAVAIGASDLFVYVAEAKHPDLPDGPHAVECSKARELIGEVRQAELMMGADARVISEREDSLRSAVRRSIVAAHNIESGHMLTETDLDYRRPRSGLDPWDGPSIIGRPVTRRFDEGQDLTVRPTDAAEA